MEVRIEESWKAALADEFAKPYFASLARRLHDEKAAGKVIYPPGRMIFKAFELTPVDKVKVVIIGQDPYHEPGRTAFAKEHIQGNRIRPGDRDERPPEP